MTESEEYKDLEDTVKHILYLDCKISRSLSIYNGHFKGSMFKKLRMLLKILEITAHGIPWLILVPAMVYFAKESDIDFLINLFIGLLVDLVVIALFKITFKRARPSYNEGDMPMSASKIDNYSFPSGHATRVFMILVMLLYSSITSFQFNCVFMWTILVGMSRVMLGRHHLSDVIAGAIVGCLEAMIVLRFLWYEYTKADENIYEFTQKEL